MKIHPLLSDPTAVLVLQTRLPETVTWHDFRQAAFRALMIMQVKLEGERVVIKPNATSAEHFANPDTGITTHPGFIHGMVDYFQEQHTPSKSITIAEDPRNSDDTLPRHWKGTGYDQLAQSTGARLHCPTPYTCIKGVVPKPLVFRKLNVSRLSIAPNTVLLNVPKLKTHNLSITTLCLKNLMGLVNVYDRHYCGQAWQEMPIEIQTDPRPRTEWFTRAMHELWQAGLARRLVDTAQVIQPALNLVEGIIAREGTGFQRGRNRPLGLVVAGVNMVAVDSLASYLMGFEPQQLVYLRHAAEAGLGENDIRRLRIYIEQDGEIVQCRDVAALRADPPLQVISNITDEEPEPLWRPHRR